MLVRHALDPKVEGVVDPMVEVVGLVEGVDDADTKLLVSYGL